MTIDINPFTTEAAVVGRSQMSQINFPEPATASRSEVTLFTCLSPPLHS